MSEILHSFGLHSSAAAQPPTAVKLNIFIFLLSGPRYLCLESHILYQLYITFLETALEHKSMTFHLTEAGENYTTPLLQLPFQ